MKTKLDLAHEHIQLALKHDYSFIFDLGIDGLVKFGFDYADAMYAEMEKREDKSLPDILFNKHECKFVYGRVCHRGNVNEWQPDWSQAPSTASYWALDADRNGNFYEVEPEICDNQWDFGDAIVGTSSFGYTGDWRESLRKRP